MVSNCNKFHLVESGQYCALIISQYGISDTDFYTWNPEVGGSSCSNLWLDAYVCVGVIGGNPAPTTTLVTSTSTTTAGNGVATPTPVRDGMAKNCDAFHLVVSGDYCQKIADDARITLAEFYAWNPDVGTTCQSLWLDYYVCISLI